MESFELLPNVGGSVDTRTLEHLTRVRDEELFIRIVRKLAQSHHSTWSSQGIFLSALEKLGIEVWKELVALLVKVGADLNHKHHYPGEFTYAGLVETYQGTIMDMAATRGDLSIVQTLLAKAQSQLEIHLLVRFRAVI
jgi:hypothetical protein